MELLDEDDLHEKNSLLNAPSRLVNEISKQNLRSRPQLNTLAQLTAWSPPPCPKLTLPVCSQAWSPPHHSRGFAATWSSPRFAWRCLIDMHMT